MKNRVIRSSVLGLVFGAAAVIGGAAPASANIVTDIYEIAPNLPSVPLVTEIGKQTPGGGPETNHGGGGGPSSGICHPGNGSPTCQH